MKDSLLTDWGERGIRHAIHIKQLCRSGDRMDTNVHKESNVCSRTARKDETLETLKFNDGFIKATAAGTPKLFLKLFFLFRFHTSASPTVQFRYQWWQRVYSPSPSSFKARGWDTVKHCMISYCCRASWFSESASSGGLFSMRQLKVWLLLRLDSCDHGPPFTGQRKKETQREGGEVRRVWVSSTSLTVLILTDTLAQVSSVQCLV